VFFLKFKSQKLGNLQRIEVFVADKQQRAVAIFSGGPPSHAGSLSTPDSPPTVVLSNCSLCGRCVSPISRWCGVLLVVVVCAVEQPVKPSAAKVLEAAINRWREVCGVAMSWMLSGWRVMKGRQHFCTGRIKLQRLRHKLQ